MILVVGASGQLGSMITRRLIARNQAVRAFVRPVAPHHELQRAGAEIAYGDLKDPASIPPALNNVRCLVTTATAFMRGGADTIDAIDLRGTAALIEAAKAAGVKQFVYVSAFGSGRGATNPMARAKGVNEARLKESGLGYTILKPASFMETWIGFLLGSQLHQGPVVKILGDGRVKHAFVSAENVADLAVAVIDRSDARNEEILLSGSTAVSFREVIEMIESVSGQTIEVNALDPGEAVPGIPSMVSELWAMFIARDDFDLDSSDVAAKYGLNLISVESYVQKIFGRGRAA